MKIYRGNIVYSKSATELMSYENGYLLVENGKVLSVEKELKEEYKNSEIIDFKNSLIIPAFSDLHVHAPQYPNRGIQMDLLLNDWLNKYKFQL